MLFCRAHLRVTRLPQIAVGGRALGPPGSSMISRRSPLSKSATGSPASMVAWISCCRRCGPHLLQPALVHAGAAQHSTARCFRLVQA